MASSCNLLPPPPPPQPRAPAGGEASETSSEVSASTASSSAWSALRWDSREDLRDFVAKLGYRDISELHQDRFRVDRKKLEQMLRGDPEAPLPADVFFEQIMTDTNTFITWPSKLKIGAKSKKDPHVRIIGKPEDVNTAKERVKSIFDTRFNRVTMKIDVSYVSHSHIIGKGGLSIKQIMEETKCHVHFPDSNRTNTLEKSNQVSIAGDLQGAEMARSRVRQKTPVIFGFELQQMPNAVELKSAYVNQIQEQYNVQVMPKIRSKLYVVLVLVKGTEWAVEQVKKATMLLVEYFCDGSASQVPIEMSLEISPHHHALVVGENFSNLKEIMRVTGAKIMFHDPLDPNLPTLKKSNVLIRGNINSVYSARQLLIGSIPLLVTFDLPFNISNKFELIASVQSKFDVIVSVRRKVNSEATMLCQIKGAERNASNIYKARNAVLGINDTSVIADIPSSYHFPTVPTTLPLLQVSVHPSRAPHAGGEAFAQTGDFNFQHPYPGCSAPYSNVSSGYQSMGPCPQSSRDSSPASWPSYASPSTSSTTCPGHLACCGAEAAEASAGRAGDVVAEASTAASSATTSPSLLKQIDSPGFHGPTFVKRRRPASDHDDFEQKRIAGYKAMQMHVSGLRYPNNFWSGYGISHTTPSALAPNQSSPMNNNNSSPSGVRKEGSWKTPPTSTSSSTGAVGNRFDFSSPAIQQLNTSNCTDQVSDEVFTHLTTSYNWTDITSLLVSLKLEKYLGIFNSHEIDLATLSSMTEKDLLDIGLTAFGARRKILLAIAELKNRSKPFSPAPGAERKTSSLSSQEWYPIFN